jgi:hypothetical protein
MTSAAVWRHAGSRRRSALSVTRSDERGIAIAGQVRHSPAAFSMAETITAVMRLKMTVRSADMT